MKTPVPTAPQSLQLPNQKKASNFHTADVVFTLSKDAYWIFFTENGDECLLVCQSSETEWFNKKNLYAPINRTVKASSLRAAYGDIILMITVQKLLHWRLLAAKRLSRSHYLSVSSIWRHIINTPNMGRKCLIPWVLTNEAILMAIQCITVLRK